jgi:hypothetical protein
MTSEEQIRKVLNEISVDCPRCGAPIHVDMQGKTEDVVEILRKAGRRALDHMEKRVAALEQQDSPDEELVPWCYGCKKLLPPEVKIQHDDHEGVPWHVVDEGARRDLAMINGKYQPVCGPIHQVRPDADPSP